jgi:hypothetical protein
MGLLDDAIREHLELKRRHGADPGEVERQEREALGSTPAEAEAEALAAQPVAEGEDAPAAVAAPADEAPLPEDFAADAPTTVPPAAAAATEPADEVEPPPGEPELPSTGREADAPGYDEDPWLEVDEDETGTVPAEREEPPAEDDVLEETPDFLQETPEHDRLWFEQKPPRDFDFD